MIIPIIYGLNNIPVSHHLQSEANLFFEHQLSLHRARTTALGRQATVPRRLPPWLLLMPSLSLNSRISPEQVCALYQQHLCQRI